MIITNTSLNKIFRILNLFIFTLFIIGSIHSTNQQNTKQTEQHQSLKEVRLGFNIVKSTNKSGTTIEKNILTQGMLNQINTRYVILYDYDLNGAEIIIPKGCILEFQGGSLSNGILVGNNTSISANITKIFNTNISFSGKWAVKESYLEWFGSTGTGKESDSNYLEKAYSLCSTVNFIKFYKLTSNFILKGGMLFSNKTATITMEDCYIDIQGNYSVIKGLNFNSNNIEACFHFGDVFECIIENCIIQKFKTVFVFNGYSAGIYIRNVTTNATDYIVRFTENINQRFNVCIEDCFLLYTKHIGSITSADFTMSNTYCTVMPYNYYLEVGWNSDVKINDCNFELDKGSESTDIKVLFVNDGSLNIEKSRFTSNKSTNTYWFGYGNANSKRFRISCSTFGNFSQENGIEGLFYNVLSPNYGFHELDNIHYNNKLIRSVSDIGGIWNSNVCKFNIINGAGITIFENDIDYSKLKKWQSYNVVSPQFELLYRAVYDGSKLIRIDTNENHKVVYSGYSNTDSNNHLIGFNFYNIPSKSHIQYLESLKEIINKSTNNNSVVDNISIKDRLYRVYVSPHFNNPKLFTVKFAKNKTKDSKDDITKTFMLINGNCYFEFNAIDTSVYKYIKFINSHGAAWTTFTIYEVHRDWREYDGEVAGISRYGESSNRPIPERIGFIYFDTTLNKPIWWTGNKWVDATGNTIK